MIPFKARRGRRRAPPKHVTFWPPAGLMPTCGRLFPGLFCSTPSDLKSQKPFHWSRWTRVYRLLIFAHRVLKLLSVAPILFSLVKHVKLNTRDKVQFESCSSNDSLSERLPIVLMCLATRRCSLMLWHLAVCWHFKCAIIITHNAMSPMYTIPYILHTHCCHRWPLRITMCVIKLRAHMASGSLPSYTPVGTLQMSVCFRFADVRAPISNVRKAVLTTREEQAFIREMLLDPLGADRNLSVTSLLRSLTPSGSWDFKVCSDSILLLYNGICARVVPEPPGLQCVVLCRI